MRTPASSPGPDPRFFLEDFEPAYLALERRGELRSRVEGALAELAECRACPRNCGVNRLENEMKVCNTGRHAVVSSAFPHFGEEDCLRGRRGSGTIFFGLCNLRCVFCQNWDISQRKAGRERSAEEIAAIMLWLQDQGCHNINFVTPEHVVPQIIEAIAAAVPAGLRLPIVYNTSSYDALSSLRLLDGPDRHLHARFQILEHRVGEEAGQRPATIPSARGRRSGRCTGRSGRSGSAAMAWRSAGSWSATW
jgi:putative pyruvate formate lyase activating enzyme